MTLTSHPAEHYPWCEDENKSPTSRDGGFPDQRWPWPPRSHGDVVKRVCKKAGLQEPTRMAPDSGSTPRFGQSCGFNTSASTAKPERKNAHLPPRVFPLSQQGNGALSAIPVLWLRVSILLNTNKSVVSARGWDPLGFCLDLGITLQSSLETTDSHGNQSGAP